MTLLEMSEEYKKSADLLRKRLAELRRLKKVTSDPEERWRIDRRIHALTKMLTETNKIAELTARYYERGYYRSAEHTCNGIEKTYKSRGEANKTYKNHRGAADGMPAGYSHCDSDLGKVPSTIRKGKRCEQKHGVPDTEKGSHQSKKIQPIHMSGEAFDKLSELLESADL